MRLMKQYIYIYSTCLIFFFNTTAITESAQHMKPTSTTVVQSISLHKFNLLHFIEMPTSSFYTGFALSANISHHMTELSVLKHFHIFSLYHATKHKTHIHNRTLLATQHNTACCHKSNWNSKINMTFNSVTLTRTI